MASSKWPRSLSILLLLILIFQVYNVYLNQIRSQSTLPCESLRLRGGAAVGVQKPTTFLGGNKEERRKGVVQSHSLLSSERDSSAVSPTSHRDRVAEKGKKDGVAISNPKSEILGDNESPSPVKLLKEIKEGEGSQSVLPIEDAVSKSPYPPSPSSASEIFRSPAPSTRAMEEKDSPHLTSSKMAVLVLSSRDAFATRTAIRETWGSGHDNVYFVVGRACPIPPELRKKWTCDPKHGPIKDNRSLKRWKAQVRAVDGKISEEAKMFGDMLIVEDIDVYRHLPHKLKSAYAWAVQKTKVEWFCKIDMDSVVRVDTLEHYLTTSYDSIGHTVIAAGFNRNSGVPRRGKWAEYPEYKATKYPPWPNGAGHVITRSIASYITKNKKKLFNAQGEDVSLGIWLDGSPFKNEIQWKKSRHFIPHSGNCRDKNAWVIGHSISAQKMRSCFKHMDEASHIAGKAKL